MEQKNRGMLCYAILPLLQCIQLFPQNFSTFLEYCRKFTKLYAIIRVPKTSHRIALSNHANLLTPLHIMAYINRFRHDTKEFVNLNSNLLT